MFCSVKKRFSACNAEGMRDLRLFNAINLNARIGANHSTACTANALFGIAHESIVITAVIDLFGL